MLKSLRYRLLAWFVVVSILSIALLLPLNYWQVKKEKEISAYVNTVYDLFTKFLESTKIATDFIAFGTNEPMFYLTGESNYLDQHDVMRSEIYRQLEKIRLYENADNFETSDRLLHAEKLMNKYFANVDSVVFMSYKKGLHDYGLVGKLNTFRYRLGTLLPQDYRLVEIVNHENRYLARSESASIERVVSLCSSIIRELNGKGTKDANIAIQYVHGYLVTINELVQLNNKLGVDYKKRRYAHSTGEYCCYPGIAKGLAYF